MQTIHGGDIYRNRIQIDFSVNINPLGIPEEVKDALHQAVDVCMQYPDMEAEQENSSLRFSESCGIINQKMKEQPLSHLAITLSKAMQVRTFRSSFWKRPRNWLDLLLTEICWTAYWFIWSIWRAHPAEIRRCLGRESTPVSVQCCWSSGLRIPYLKEV